MKLSIRLIALVLCAAMGLSLCGCRYSSVLEQIIYDMTKTDVVEDQYFFPEDNVEDSENNTEELSPIEENETERSHDQEANLPTADEENSDVGTQMTYQEDERTNLSTTRQISATEEGDAKGTNHSDSTAAASNANGNSTRGNTKTSQGVSRSYMIPTEDSSGSEAGSQEDSGNSSEASTGEGTGQLVNSPLEGTGESGNGVQGTEKTDGGDDTIEQVVDGSNSSGDKETTTGSSDPDPEYASAGTIAAVGSAAVMVMMLSGDEKNPVGALCATNEDLKNSSACEVFPGLSEVDQVWFDDGTTFPYSSDFNRLLEMKPEAVVYTEGDSTFSTSQFNSLMAMYEEIYGEEEAAGHIVVLEDMTSSQEAVMDNMDRLAGILADTYPEAADRAAEYREWSGELMELAADEDSSVYTLYIDGWDSYVEYSLRQNSVDDCFTGVGSAYISNKLTDLGATVVNFMHLGGVTDIIDLNKTPIVGEVEYFMPLVTNATWVVTNASKASPYFWNTSSYTMYTQEQYPAVSTGGGEDTQYSYGKGPGLGNPGFTVLVAGDEETKRAIVADRDSGSGVWSQYGSVQGTLGGQNATTFTVEHGFVNQGGNLMVSYVYGDYDVVTNPCGLATDWVTAGPETILESLWVAYRLRGAVERQAVVDEISYFYETFCRCHVSDDDIIRNILMETP